MMQMVMVQLHPLLEGFNHSLQHLSRQVAELARNMKHMKHQHQGAPMDGSALDEVAQVIEKEKENLHARLDQVLEQVTEVCWQRENQRMQLENRLHSQHVMLHHNLTSFKMDVDVKLKRHHKMLQVKKSDCLHER